MTCSAEACRSAHSQAHQTADTDLHNYPFIPVGRFGEYHLQKKADVKQITKGTTELHGIYKLFQIHFHLFQYDWLKVVI